MLPDMLVGLLKLGVPSHRMVLQTGVCCGNPPPRHQAAFSLPLSFYHYFLVQNSNSKASFPVGFSLSPISANGHYNLASGAPAPTIPSLNAAQIPICMDPLHVAESVALLKSPHPPRYLQLFNEPDHSFKGLTPLTSAANAARAVKPLFDNKPAGTTFVSPALASSDSRYLELFRAACPECWAKIAIVAAHIYHPIVKDVLAQIRRLHDRFPDKRIWLTEIAPASWVGQGCKLNKQGVIGWMQALMPQIVALGYVDKVFWNAGEWVRFSFLFFSFFFLSFLPSFK